MLYTLRFTAELDHTVEVQALDLDEAIAQADDDRFKLPDCEHVVTWHYTSATVDGHVVQEEPRLHEQRRDRVAELEVELAQARAQLCEQSRELERMRPLVAMASRFAVSTPQGTATITNTDDRWLLTPHDRTPRTPPIAF